MSDEMKKLIGQAVVDEAFRQELFDNPEQAMKDFGLSNDERKQVKDAVKDATKKAKGQQIGNELNSLRGGSWA